MIPFMKEGIEKVKEGIRSQEIEASFPRIDMIVEQKIREIGDKDLIEINKVEQKRKDFKLKLENTQDPEEKKKFTNYISVLDFVLGGRNGN